MTQKIAIALIHGMGTEDPEFDQGLIQEPGFGKPFKAKLWQQFQQLGISAEEANAKFVIDCIYWAPVLQVAQNVLWQRLQNGRKLKYSDLRTFILGFLADAIAYQITPNDRWVYDAIHGVIAQTFNRLAQKAGESAPLCVIAHSLGTAISSNYLYDLQNDFQSDSERELIIKPVKQLIDDTPLERGETLSLFYTMGSPIALWSLRYKSFGKPIQFPTPGLIKHHPQLQPEWINFYDQDDVIAYPLKPINEEYQKSVTQDIQVDCGSWLESWNPLSHNGYWTDKNVISHIAKSLIAIWNVVNL